ncbi:Putative glutamine synthetase, catalytic domain, metal-dependent hydrolase [Colletotrichum destructivum]|uniref:Glutamine synthetase n=1 Tax=Colletotrichum destructivum TaxID=34406 RepID=A0AAX4IZ11_9PEZI|nr:Putative glutamine synthetase, catalytic domain, metal-dependent hydrolase [Colletotrichum destructivum]
MDPAKLTGQALLSHTIQTTPIIDNHAHPLLDLDAIGRYPLLSITTEAHGDAIHASLTSLAHLRAVKQLAKVLRCEPSWEAVVNAIEAKRIEDYDAWVAECLNGIESVLVDDGLDGEDAVYPYSYFSDVTRSPAKRIVRIEKIAADIINHHLPKDESAARDAKDAGVAFEKALKAFDHSIAEAIADPEVVGFKSVICYRTGLAIPRRPDAAAARKAFETIHANHTQGTDKAFTRVNHHGLNEYLVHRLACLIRNATGTGKKPIQFHTGLGDNDITLTSASPSHLQDFIRQYPTVPIVLLHASYPFVREAGYLACVYSNVYADIGEIFPFLSRDGQETALRQILELCPWSKILWSTDGHWFPETYLLAVLQMREVLEKVLCEYARKGHMTWREGTKLVKDILFNNSNHIYHLGLEFSFDESFINPRRLSGRSDLDILEAFLDGKKPPQYLRVYWNDLTATSRVRAVPMRKVLSVLNEDGDFSLSITKASLGLLQNDMVVPGASGTGEYRLHPDFTSLQEGPREGHISVFGDFRELEGSSVAYCPRSLLQRVVEIAARHGLTFHLGFEIELVLLERMGNSFEKYRTLDNDGHAWSTARMMDHPVFTKVIERAVAELDAKGIYIEQVHPESAPGQFEVILPQAPPLEAVDTLLYVREVISSIAVAEGYRMTLHPKPFPTSCGTAAHVHMSITSAGGSKPETYNPFYAGILKHLRAIAAFTYSNPVSYERVQDGAWAGGRWVTWGTQNRETPLRKIEDSHWEVKCMDGLANPYLAIAALLGAGTHGFGEAEKLTWGDCEVDPASLTANDRKELGVEQMLPSGLPEALKALRGDEVMNELLGEDLIERYITIKEEEMKNLDAIGSDDRRQWIMERY